MSVWETVLIYVVPPVVVYVVVFAATLGRRRAKRERYRAGESWNHEPVLWVANPEGAHLPAPHAVLEAGSGTTGGARGHW